MLRTSPTSYRLVLPMLEPGHFQAKAFFLPDKHIEAAWPDGENTHIKVESADYYCSNIVYNAFIRQFGQARHAAASSHTFRDDLDTLDSQHYTAIPPSGTFRDLIAELDFIVGTLGCRIIQLLPIHPTPTVYGRMGRFGSPFAALDFHDVDAGLADFDRGASPMAQFAELVDEVHARQAKIFLDIAINHTGWASTLQAHHPEWFVRNDDGSYTSPGAWGVVWEDLIKLDYSHHDLWQYMADVMLSWCRRGVDGFRCDAGYKVPVKAWEYIVAAVRGEFPDTVFLLEGLGGKVSVTRDLLIDANLNWAYSELFQNYHRDAIESYLPKAIDISLHEGIMLNFAETHDNNRLASVSPAFARLRTALAALTSVRGAYGFANGVEWYAAEKIDVHEANALNWGSANNQVAFIATLNHILATNATFHDDAELRMIQRGDGNSIAFYRYAPESGEWLLVLVNLDHDTPNPVSWLLADATGTAAEVIDLITKEPVTTTVRDGTIRVMLQSGDVMCLTTPVPSAAPSGVVIDELAKTHRIVHQRLRHKALELIYRVTGLSGCDDADPVAAGKRLFADPVSFCESICSRGGERVHVSWTWPVDLHRVVMVPPGFAVYMIADAPFHVQLMEHDRVTGRETSLPQQNGRHFVLLPPRTTPDTHQNIGIQLTLYGAHGCRRERAGLLYLAPARAAVARLAFDKSDVAAGNLRVLTANQRATMLMANAPLGEIRSKYDALLAGNLNRHYPDERQVMLTRYRMWVVSRNFSHAIGIDCLDRLYLLNDMSSHWTYTIPGANGKLVRLSIRLRLAETTNQLHMVVQRKSPPGDNRKLVWDNEPVTLIIRPDIDDRNFHAVTRASAGPEQRWPGAISIGRTQVVFAPSPDRRLTIRITNGTYKPTPEWQYDVFLPTEASRGLETHTDIFSPGYFKCDLDNDGRTVVSAVIHGANDSESAANEAPADTVVLDEHVESWPDDSILETMKRATSQYVVSRGANATVIAGYPWFLDWGRDTLICTRGMITAGLKEDVRSILVEFGGFEDRGTLPNMIHGADTGDRDTSDAPLWFIVACRDLIQADGTSDLLDRPCNGRPLRVVIRSIIMSYMEGTPNGIRMDPDSGLIYSPSHFTWMDTNHPAGTPRQGYPIEIQALWYAALNAAAEWLALDRFRSLADQVGASIIRLYAGENGYLSDCLHGNRDTAAAAATQDDALRPNQLLAITLGAVRDAALCRQMLSACETLIVPGAIRSLADRPVRIPLPVYRDGALLNDPRNPYWGSYTGDEDTRRKPAYHNGTAWTWMFPSFAEAWHLVYGEAGRDTALAILGSSTVIINSGCIGHVPEILDGNAPHTERGCTAQAWGVTELLRVLQQLT